MLEYMEAKKCYDFSEGDLGGNEIAMAEDCAYAWMLEGSSSTGNGTWIRQCHFTAGKNTDDARDDRAMTLMMD
jgi:hypothetical protein